MEINKLKQLGLSEGEARVYLALLKLKESTAGPIVDEAKVTRSKIYDILERLKRKGLVSYITKESTKYFRVADPSNLLQYIEEKEKNIEDQKTIILKELTNLEKLYLSSVESKIAEVFFGYKGMQNAFNLLIKEFNSKETYFAFGAGKGENIEKVKIFFDELHKERIKNKVKSYIIFNESSRGIFKSQEKSKFVDARYISNSTPAAINVYKNYTIIALLLEDPIIFVIHNKEVADSFKEYFKVMWKVAKK